MNQIGAADNAPSRPWFSVTERLGKNVHIATPKEGFREYLEGIRQKKEDSYTARPPMRSISDLTKGELQNWSKKYDLEHMTEESYSALIDELVSSGVLNEQDKEFVDMPKAVGPDRLQDVRYCLGSYIVPLEQKDLLTLDDADGNVLKWAEFRASIQGPAGGNSALSPYGARSAALFDRLSDIFHAIQMEG